MKQRKTYFQNLFREKRIFKISYSLLVIISFCLSISLYFGLTDYQRYQNESVNVSRYEYALHYYDDLDKKVNNYRRLIIDESVRNNEASYEKYEVPQKTFIKIQVDEIYDLDERTDSFIAEGTIEANWEDASIQNYDILNRNENLHLLTKEDVLSTAKLNFFNAEDQLYERVNLIKSENPKGRNYSKYKYKGRFKVNRDLRKFPFEETSLIIRLSHQLPAADIFLSSILESNVMDGFFRINSHFYKATQCYADQYDENGNLEKKWPKEYDCSYINVRQLGDHNLALFYDRQYLSNELIQTADSLNYEPSVELSTTIQRSSASSFFRYFVPLIFGVIILSINDNVSSQYSDIKIATPPTILLTFIFMQSGVHSEIPQISYITYLDYIYYLCYLLAVIAMTNAVITGTRRNKLNKYIYWISHKSLAKILRLLFIVISIFGPFIIWMII